MSYDQYESLTELPCHGSAMETEKFKRYRVFGDESGTHGAQYYGFGYLWVPDWKYDELCDLVGGLRAKYDYDREMKWGRVDDAFVELYEELVDAFFRHNWLMFSCIRVNRHYVRHDEYHEGSSEKAMRKHAATYLRTRIERFCGRSSRKQYDVYVDELPYSYHKSAEVIQITANNELNSRIGRKPIRNLEECNSKEEPGIQICDVLLGAVLEPWNQDADPESKRGGAKYRIIQKIGDKMGERWDGLRPDTKPHVWKYNICHFYSPNDGSREIDAESTRPEWRM
jgi:hypothetical protein